MVLLTRAPSRLLDLLLDVNNSGQIPPDKRIDLSLDLPSDDEAALTLDIDRPSTPPPGPTPDKSFKKLLEEVPHHQFSSATERFPSLLADLEAIRDSPADPAQGQNHPPSFLTADDLDNYIWELDTHLAHEDAATGTGKTDAVPLPTLAPLTHPDGGGRPNPKDAQRDFAVRNPTSVYNWLRKHAPKTFLQDAEHDKEGGGGGGKENGDDHSHGGHGGGSGSGRRGGKGERGSRGGGGGAARTKRASAAHIRAQAAAAESFDDVDDEASYTAAAAAAAAGGGAVTPSAASAGKGKRKRVADDDPGYRPKGGSSRPTKKKRKSEGPADKGTPSAGKPRKSDPPGGAVWPGRGASSEKSSTTTTYKGPRKSDPSGYRQYDD